MTSRRNMVVETPEALEGLVDSLAGHDVVAVDTEFHGEKRYWPELYLVQLSTVDSTAAVDPLAVRDLSPLTPLFTDQSTTKAFHSAKNDIAILRRALDAEVVNVFDTQIAASFLGYGEQCGLTYLLREVCKIRPQKRFSMSDWSRRPLSREQLEYALDDVRYLIPLYEDFSRRLEEKGRLQWCLSETEFLSSADTYETSVETIYQKTRSSGRLRKGCEGVLWELVRWRESTARSLDRPRQRVASDDLLRRIAAMSPTSVESLGALRGLPGGLMEAHGKKIVETVSHAREAPPADVPHETRRRSDPGASARRDVLRIYAKSVASSLGIARTVLLPGETLNRLCSTLFTSRDQLEEIPGMRGWRMDLMGRDGARSPFREKGARGRASVWEVRPGRPEPMVAATVRWPS